MNSKKTIALLLAAIMLFAICSCRTAEPAKNTTGGTTGDTPEKTVVTDMIGREIAVIPGSYNRVVCIGAGALRMYSYVCDTAILCGVEDIDNLVIAERPQMFDGVARPYIIAFENVFSKLPSCGVGGPGAQAAESEKILSCNPDIVISEYEDKEKEDALQTQLGVPVITLKSGYDGVFDEAFAGSLSLLGTVFGREKQAKTLIDYVSAQAAEISRRTNDIEDPERPGAYICGLGNWGTTNHLTTAQDYKSFSVANVKNVLTDLTAKGVAPIEQEKFVSIGGDMDIMIIDAAAVKNIKPLYAQDSTMFDTCKAWQNKEVYLQMAYNAYYTNYETALVNTWFIAKTVYPEAFADIDITAKTNEVTKAFLGQELADEIFSYPNSFGGYQKIDTENFFK